MVTEDGLDASDIQNGPNTLFVTLKYYAEEIIEIKMPGGLS